jgi:RNA polymerase sigma factor (sigma-70 family)
VTEATSEVVLADAPVGLEGADGDRLHELYRRHWKELCRYISHTFGRGPPEPEDVVQTVFAQFAALPDSKAIENPRAFLYRSAHNVVVDYHRREAVRSRFSAELTDATPEPANELGPERVLSSRQRLSIIEAAIRAMEPKRRTVFVMNRIHELSFAEIERRTGIPESTVKYHVVKATVECERALRLADPRAGNKESFT